jgi:putative ABC transport system substrate-binding protein
VRRRTFLSLVGGAATSAFAARAQPSGPASPGLRRLGVLTIPAADDPLYKPRAAALVEGLAIQGWKAGGNINIDWRHTGGDPVRLERYADELIALSPDALLAVGSPCVEALQRRTRTIPIAFTIVTDPVGQGSVESLSRPGGNITGFTDFDLSMGGKWLEMLTEIAPPVATIGVLYNPATAPLADRMMLAVREDAAWRGVTVRAAQASDEAGVEQAAAEISRDACSALLVLPDAFTVVNRSVIIASAARARLPAVNWNRAFVLDGGLMSYGADNDDLHRRSASYVDRILKGADPRDLPVQYPTRFDLAINLKTAKALGMNIPSALLAPADEVIE